MQASDIILLARRSAGLTQDELADRLGRPRSTIARWELAETEPSYRSVREAVAACDRELAVDVLTPDSSYLQNIDPQLRRPPGERVRHLAGAEAARTIEELAQRGSEAILIGDAAAVLLGGPLRATHSDPVELCATPPQARALAGLANLSVHEQPPGTRGYRDLRRDAESVPLTGGAVLVASPLDLMRIELARHRHLQAHALQSLLTYRHRWPDGPPPPLERTEEETREVLEAWLSR